MSNDEVDPWGDNNNTEPNDEGWNMNASDDIAINQPVEP